MMEMIQIIERYYMVFLLNLITQIRGNIDRIYGTEDKFGCPIRENDIYISFTYS